LLNKSTSVYFARKSIHLIIAENGAEQGGLKRALGWVSLMAMGIGGIIGAGIFVLTGQPRRITPGRR